MLAQKGKHISYASRILNASQQNYSITVRECLAVIWALEKFRCFFSELPVKAVTDQSALTNGKSLSSFMERWSQLGKI